MFDATAQHPAQVDQHTPPNGTVTVAAMSRAIDAAAKRAVTADDVAAVKRAREAVRAYSLDASGGCHISYAEAAEAVVALERVALRAERPFVDGVVFIESSSTPGTFYRCVGSACTCKAGSHGRACKHLEQAAKGEGWRAAPASQPADPFARVRRDAEVSK